MHIVSSSLDIIKSQVKCRGFSLLEILVVAVLGLLLLEIIYQSYLSAKNIYRAQKELASLSENIRFADFFLWQNIMQAGFAGCRKVSEFYPTNHILANSGDPPMGFGIHGYDSEHPPEYLKKSKVAEGTDIIVVGKAHSEATYILKSIEPGADSFSVANNPTTKGNRFLLISDCENADLFVAANHKVKKAQKVLLSSRDKLSHSYSTKNTQVRVFEELTFFIREYPNHKKRKIRGLYVCTNRGLKEELIPDVMDMQISYGFDSNKPSKYLKAKEIIDPKLWDKVSWVKIDLKMRSQLLVEPIQLYIKLRQRG